MKTPNNSVSVQVTHNGQTIVPSPQGYLGQNFSAGDIFEMTLTLAQPEEGKRYLRSSDRMRENLAQPQEVTPGVYRHSVPVICKDPGAKYDRDDADRNCVHLIEMGVNGLVSVTNIVIVGQDQDFFLIFHPTYVAQSYNNDGRVAVPVLRIEPGFPSLIPLIEQNYAKRVSTLPAFAKRDQRLEADIKPDIMAAAMALQNPNDMVVKFWSVRTGTGGALRKLANGWLDLVKIERRKINGTDRWPRYLLI